jgi:nitrogen fixation/metabolism regulation signal transduction histidine kinase
MKPEDIFGHGSVRPRNWRVLRPLKVLAPGTSLRRRVGYSLLVVRLVLAPVIFIAIYYLVVMGRLVDRIVNVDAQVSTLAESLSIEMLNARRMELNYFLLGDSQDLNASRASLDAMQQTSGQCEALQPGDRAAVREIRTELATYRQSLDEAVARAATSRLSVSERFRKLVMAYEGNFDKVLARSRRESRAQLLEDLRDQSGSFDSQVANALAAGNPELRGTTQALEASSNRILQLSADLEKRSRDDVRGDHLEARRLVRRAELVLLIVSPLVILLSIIVGIILPRQVVKPLMDLKAAVDHASAGHYGIEFDIQGKGEVAQLARSVRDLIEHASEKAEESKTHRSG